MEIVEWIMQDISKMSIILSVLSDTMYNIQKVAVSLFIIKKFYLDRRCEKYCIHNNKLCIQQKNRKKKQKKNTFLFFVWSVLEKQSRTFRHETSEEKQVKRSVVQ